MKRGLVIFQVGKGGINDAHIENLRKAFKSRDIIKVSILKSHSRDRAEVKKIASHIISGLGKNFIFRIVGFTIILRKLRKARG
ncbi:MAG: YhbY family RNA-binding protein [Nanoarchaeota archaeon]